MTSNAADQAICDVCADSSEKIDNDDLLEAIRPDLQRYFKPAFLGRTTIVPYYPLNDEELSKITEISLNRIWSEHVRASPTRICASGLSAMSSGCPESSGHGHRGGSPARHHTATRARRWRRRRTSLSPRQNTRATPAHQSP